MNADELAERSRRLSDEAWSEGRMESIEELVDGAYVGHDPVRSMQGREELEQRVAEYRRAFPDLRMTVEDVIVQGDESVVRWVVTGTHRGDWEGLAATGRPARAEGITINRWRDGRVAESWTHYDVVGVLRQLGALPAEGSAGERLFKALQRVAVAGRHVGEAAAERLKAQQAR